MTQAARAGERRRVPQDDPRDDRALPAHESAGHPPEAARAGEPDPVLVLGEQDLRSMERYLLSSARDLPAIALTTGQDLDVAVLSLRDVRRVVGDPPRIFVIAWDALLDRQSLPGELALERGSSARIWWPGLASTSNPKDHPLVSPQEEDDAVEVFSRAFDLSRPTVRKELSRLEGLLTFTERQLDRAIQSTQASSATSRTRG